MNIAVYCSARSNIAPIHIDDARALGQWIGRNGHTLVYGGLDLGLMGIVASETKSAGGRVIGVVPDKKSHLVHPANDENIPVATLHQRKAEMEARADAFVALAGGYGTLDEVMSALASMSFFSRPKPLVMIGRDGLYQPLALLFSHMISQHLLSTDVADNLHIVDSPDKCFDLLTHQP